jgi:hypothetical protein
MPAMIQKEIIIKNIIIIKQKFNKKDQIKSK